MSIEMLTFYKYCPWLRYKDIDYCKFHIFINSRFLLGFSKKKYFNKCLKELKLMNKLSYGKVKVFEYDFGNLYLNRFYTYKFRTSIFLFIYYKIFNYYFKNK